MGELLMTTFAIHVGKNEHGDLLITTFVIHVDKNEHGALPMPTFAIHVGKNEHGDLLITTFVIHVDKNEHGALPMPTFVIRVDKNEQGRPPHNHFCHSRWKKWTWEPSPCPLLSFALIKMNMGALPMTIFVIRDGKNEHGSPPHAHFCHSRW